MDEPISSLMHALPARVNADPHLQRIGRYCRTEFMLEAGASSFHFGVDRGRLHDVVVGPRPLRAWAFALRAQPADWHRFWALTPAPGFNDIFAMSRYGHLRIEGDVGPLLEHLWYMKEVLALPRQMLAEVGA